jgi:acyl-CoA hydrolase
MRIVRLQTTFLRPVGLGDSVAIGGRVAKVTRGHDGVDVVLRLLVRTRADELACVGEAAGRIPAA